MQGHSLIVPFLTDDPAFAHGVELGMLYARMRDGEEGVIEDYFLLDNQDRILLMASRLCWQASQIEAYDDEWFRCRLERPEKATAI